MMTITTTPEAESRDTTPDVIPRNAIKETFFHQNVEEPEIPQHGWGFGLFKRKTKPADPLDTRVVFRKSDFLKHQQHLEYLKRVSEGDSPPITRQTALMAKIAWQEIWQASGFSMPVPAACTGPDGQMFYSWDKGRHHLELDILPGQPGEFFYRDRESGELWSEDFTIGSPLPSEVVPKLYLFEETKKT